MLLIRSIYGHFYQIEGSTLITDAEIDMWARTGDPCGNNQWIAGVHDVSDGIYALRGIPPGTYYLQTSSNDSKYLDEWYTAETVDPSDWECSAAQEITLIRPHIM